MSATTGTPAMPVTARYSGLPDSHLTSSTAETAPQRFRYSTSSAATGHTGPGRQSMNVAMSGVTQQSASGDHHSTTRGRGGRVIAVKHTHSPSSVSHHTSPPSPLRSHVQGASPGGLTTSDRVSMLAASRSVEDINMSGEVHRASDSSQPRGGVGITLTSSAAEVVSTVGMSSDDEDDVAGRVLRSLQEKDRLIAVLSADVQRAAEEVATARHSAWLLEEEARHLGADLHASNEETARLRAALNDRGLRHDHEQSLELRRAVETLRLSEGRVTALEGECERRDRELTLVQGELRHAQHQWELHAAEERSLQAQVRGYVEQISRVEAELNMARADTRQDAGTLRAHIAHLQADLTSKTAELAAKEKQHKKELSGLREELLALTGQFDTYEAQVAQQRDVVRDLAYVKQRERDGREELRRAEAQWVAATAALRAEVAELRRQRDHAEQMVKSCEEDRDAMSAELAEAQQDVSTRIAQHAVVESKLAALQGTVQQLQHTADDLSMQLQQSKSRHQLDEERITSLRAAVESSMAALQEKEAEMHAMQVTHAEHVARVLVAEEERQSTVLGKVEGCVQTTTALQDALLTAEKRRQEAVVATAAACAERDRYRIQAQDAATQARRDALECQELAADTTQFHREKLSEAHNVITQQAKALRDASDELGRAREQVGGLEARLAEAIGRHTAEVTARQEAEAQADQLRHDVVTAKEEHRDALTAQLSVAEALVSMETKLKAKERALAAVLRRQRMALDQRRAEARALAEIASILNDGRSRTSHDRALSGAAVSRLDIHSGEQSREHTAVEGCKDEELNTATATHSSCSSAAAVEAATPRFPPLRLLRAHAQQLRNCVTDQQRQLDAKRLSVQTLLTERARAEEEAVKAEATHAEALKKCERRAKETALARAREEHDAALQRLASQAEQAYAESIAAIRVKEAQRDAKNAAQQARRCSAIAVGLVRFVEMLPGAVYDTIIEHQQRHGERGPSRGEGTVSIVPGDPLPPPVMELRESCDMITREFLGLDGGWQELSAAAMAAGSTVVSRAPPCTSEPATTAAATVTAQRWAWEPGQLVELTTALTRYLQITLPAPSSLPPSVTAVARPTVFPAAIGVRPEVVTQHTASPSRVCCTATATEIPSLANALRDWVTSLRRETHKKSGSAASAAPGALSSSRVTGSSGNSPGSSDELLTDLMLACMAHVFDRVITS